MAGKINKLISGCTLTQTTTSSSVAASSSSTIVFVSLNSQIRVGMKVSFPGSASGILVSSVVEEFVGADRRTKVTLSIAQSINNSTSITFTATDGVYSNTGRYKDNSTFNITISRKDGMILSPAPSVDFSDTNSANDYFITVTDTKNNGKLIQRLYTVKHTVPLKTNVNNDVISIICRASQDKVNGSTKIYGYDLLAKPPQSNWNTVTNQAVSNHNNIKIGSTSSLRNVNKLKDNRLLVVYGDPAATLTVKAVSNTVTGTTQASTTGSTVTVSNAQSSKILVGALVTGTGTVAGDVVSAVNTSTHVVTLSNARTIASGVTLSFISSLIASATKTIGSTGIYSNEVKFPKNNTTADLVYTFTLTEIATDSFVNIPSPLTFTVTSNGVATPTTQVSVPPVRTKQSNNSNPLASTYATANQQASQAGADLN